MPRSLAYILLCVIYSLSITACRKAAQVDGPGLIKSLTIDGNPCVVSYLYDDAGRITSATQCDTAEIYTYAGDTITMTHTVSGAVGYVSTYYLDGHGRAAGYRTSVTGGLQTDYTISYDDDGHRVLLTDVTHADNYTSYTIAAGNNAFDTTISTITGSSSVTRTFYIGTSNTLSNENYGKTFLGESSANLKKTETFNVAGSSYTVQYTYQLNYLNGISRRTAKVNDSVIETREYEYYSGD